jgi:hypothetical protein
MNNRIKILILMAASAGLLAFAADPARWINIQTDSNTANKHSKIQIYQGESVQFDVAVRNGSKRQSLPSDAVPVWKAWLEATPNTLVINSTGTLVSASGGQVRVTLTPAAANVAVGTYKSAVWMMSGSTYKGTAAAGDLEVLYSPAGSEPYTAPTGTRLVHLVDVSTNAPTDGQVLAFDATSGDWTNATAGAGSGDLTEMQVSGGMLTVASGTGPIPVVGLTTSAVQTAVGISNYVLGSATNVLASTADLSAYLPLAGGTMTGALSGRDVAADGTKLDGVEALADVTDTANVEAALPATTKGDLLAFSTTITRLPIGTDDFVLTADAAEATGMKWVAASGGGGSAGGLVWISAAQFFSFDTTSNEWGHLIHELDSGSYKLEGTGIHSTSSTAQAGRLRATVAVPKGSTSWATTDAIKIKWWGDDTAGDAKIIRVDMWGRDAAGTRNVIELFTPSGGSKTATLLNVPEEMKWDAADLTLGTIFETITIEITLGTANSDAAWINGVMLDFD